MDNLVKISIAQDHEDNWYVLPFDLVDQFVDDVWVTPVGRNKNIVNQYNECLLTLGYNSLELWTSLPVCNDKGGVLDVDIDRIEQVEIVFCTMGGMYIVPASMYDEFKKDLSLYPDLINPFVTEDHLYNKWNIYSVGGNVLQIPHVSFFTPPLANMDAIKALVRPFIECVIRSYQDEDDEYIVPLVNIDVFEKDEKALDYGAFKKKYRQLRLLKENGQDTNILYSKRFKRVKRVKVGSGHLDTYVANEKPERFIFTHSRDYYYFIPSQLEDKFTKGAKRNETGLGSKFFIKWQAYQYHHDDRTTVYARLPAIAAVNQQKNI
jgi:hypothetical protein